MDELYEGILVEFYDRYLAENAYVRRTTEAIAVIKSYHPGAKEFLELACGTGRFTKYLVDAGFHVTATDLSADEIAKATRKGIGAAFSVMDMQDLDHERTYDVVGCFYESFRYLPSYDAVVRILSRINTALKDGGLFLVDFSHFPPGRPVVLSANTAVLDDGLRITQRTTIGTEGDFDVRHDRMAYEIDGKDVTGQEYAYEGRRYLLKRDVVRSPLLRISPKQMRKFLARTGFETLEVREGFGDTKESLLFVARKR